MVVYNHWWTELVHWTGGLDWWTDKFCSLVPRLFPRANEKSKQQKAGRGLGTRLQILYYKPLLSSQMGPFYFFGLAMIHFKPGNTIPFVCRLDVNNSQTV